MVVGVPPMLAMYAVVGSSRPDRDDSRWHPFQDLHGVSGHTFMGAVPFLTAAMMTDDPWLQAPLVAGSFLTGWARINNDRHYFSQAVLGWWMAYWACRSVDQTQGERKSCLISPSISPDCTGVAVQFRY
jgi:PAP2 superfamily